MTLCFTRQRTYCQATALAALVALVSHAKELDPAGALQATVDKAIANGVPELVIPPGNYDFGNRTFLIRGAKDMVLTTTGATAWFWGANGGIVLKECSNVVFKGFSLDRNPAPFFQAKVEEVDGKSCRPTPVMTMVMLMMMVMII